MPARETVAGDALRRSSTSKWSVTFGRSIGMRSLFASVRMRLSSITVFMFSIQMASTGPSRTSHVKFFLSLLALRHSARRCPRSTRWRRHVEVAEQRARERSPSGSSGRTRGAAGRPSAAPAASALAPDSQSVRCSVSTMRDLPTPDGPTSMSEWRTSAISYTWMTLSTHVLVHLQPELGHHLRRAAPPGRGASSCRP